MEIAAEFDREDPAHPTDRRVLTESKERLWELHQQIQEYVGPFDLPGPNEEEMEETGENIRRAAEGQVAGVPRRR